MRQTWSTGGEEKEAENPLFLMIYPECSFSKEPVWKPLNWPYRVGHVYSQLVWKSWPAWPCITLDCLPFFPPSHCLAFLSLLCGCTSPVKCNTSCVRLLARVPGLRHHIRAGWTLYTLAEAETLLFYWFYNEMP